MNWISQIFFVVLITALISDVVFAMWWIFQLAFTRWSPTLVYNTLRWIVVLFLLPVGYVAINISHHSDYLYAPDTLWQNSFFINEAMMPIVRTSAIIWLIGIVVAGCIIFKFKSSSNEDKELNLEETDSFVLSEQKRVQQLLNVKQKIEIIRNPEIDVPHVKGVFKKRIMMPCNKYTHDEIKITMYHEITHVKKHDLFFKALGWVIVAVQWFNPMVYLIPTALNRWSESDCDAKALKAMEQEIEPNNYYEMLMRMASDEQDRRHLLNFSMLVEDKRSIERRIEYMRKLQSANGLPKIVTVVLAAAFALFSTTTAYAAGAAMADANDKIREATDEVIIVEANDDAEVLAEDQFIVSAEEYEDVTTVYMESDVMLLGMGTFAWNIPANTRYVTGKIYLSKGDVITIACTVKPSTSSYRFGLVLPSGSTKVAQGSGGSTSDFEITTSGYYQVMVQNLSAVTVEAAGSYTY